MENALQKGEEVWGKETADMKQTRNSKTRKRALEKGSLDTWLQYFLPNVCSAINTVKYSKIKSGDWVN